MRFTLATIALVGLGNNIPDGLSKRVPVPPRIPHDPDPIEPGEPSDPGQPANPSGPHIGETDPSNPPPSQPHIGQSGSSTAEASNPDLGTSTTPKQVPQLGVGNPYSKVPIDSDDAEELGIDLTAWPKAQARRDENEVAIFNAQNKYDQPAVASQKLYTSDIVMSVFKGEGKNPSDLAKVHVDEIINPESTQVFDMIFGNLRLNPETDTKTFYSTDEGAMKVYFNKINATPFPQIVMRMNQQFSTGKVIKSFTLKPRGVTANNDYQDLDIVLGAP
ncbi:hypothetical protein L207DRAFT_590755 [Hyaloscypha variabilis F]|uniref:Uncharacterized protein n=1 Tax=Hyaloscypha variabilis (strain UAMH 11265 / GT02V1 / F) TaxID=1149755 RepID=A0A2J6R1R9_HYAVF|nr:hypothetical protein L207DRAFT_590755 [Hyaloscypha variabilis F]